MDYTKDYQNFILELMFENELDNLKRKAFWWIFCGILLLIIGIIYLLAIAAYSYDAGLYLLIYLLPTISIGIAIFFIGILTFLSYLKYKEKYNQIQKWRYNLGIVPPS